MAMALVGTSSGRDMLRSAAERHHAYAPPSIITGVIVTMRNIQSPRRLAHFCLLLALSTLLAAPHLPAQAAPQVAGREPVVVALVEGTTEGTATAEILRSLHGLPHDVIVLTDGKRPGYALASALFSLLVAREVQGDTTTSSARVRVPQGTVPHAWLGNGEMARAIATVERLRTMPARTLPGVGQARVLTLQLPKGALRGRLARTAS